MSWHLRLSWWSFCKRLYQKYEDNEVGAVVGTGIGIGVPWLHLRRWDTHVQIAPVGAHGLGLAGTF